MKPCLRFLMIVLHKRWLAKRCVASGPLVRNPLSRDSDFSDGSLRTGSILTENGNIHEQEEYQGSTKKGVSAPKDLSFLRG